FYEEPNGDIYLTTYANIDDGGSAAATSWNLDIYTSGNETQDLVSLSDDGGEMKLICTEADEKINYYQGRFRYAQNTDGAVIGPFKGDDFGMQVRILESGDINNASFYSSTGDSFDLYDSGEGAITSFIIKFQKYWVCDPVSE
ncbi:MAG: hypothetical protein HRT44_10200, partial [Bdellovibrionales bacterium]|nr:hypothetical protein [Bdellovibrionales bacterium]NQZ19611.1 hypothetical protein [Bdellovibrionales bacterium]